MGEDEPKTDEIPLSNDPGSPAAINRGCCCSVLANAAFRTRTDESPLFDPACPVHGLEVHVGAHLDV